MEKFSAFRDPGTGIQPFLRPVPPTGSEVLTTIALPLGYVLAVLRTSLILILGILHAVVVEGVCLALKPVPPLHRAITHLFTAVLLRLVLVMLGLPWIPVEMVTRKRGRGAKAPERWSPSSGDIIVSNSVSTIEILWLAFRFNPIFVLPVYFASDFPEPSARTSSPVSRAPGRRTGTGSAAISSPAARAPTPRVPIAGFRQVSLLGILRATGRVPEATQPGSPGIQSLEEIRSSADRPVVVFPECTTSNGRGLLRFAQVFKGVSVPVTKFKVYVMCVRYDPPTALSPTMSHSIPSSVLNPIPQFFSLTTSLVPFTMSIRLLAPTESPSSGTFLASEFLAEGKHDDYLSEACASLIAQIGKVKRVGFGWEDKAAFLEFYKSKK
ncbi:hypothetical protein DAEQUDRAFT_665718 [Daedalea quercina L-15889]|uniref:Phospholipid/glycerol acyltransferase domain-containing protein n=1 Tax=Daedalea quercina L-15889 TaxID=1314783 RepID=A0A165S687_9APHY|nr:hypothetical protein DAEQUDRAFT_665718 [Daedalea quercina L-15889]